MITPSNLYDEILSTIWFPSFIQWFHYSVRISHKVHDHLLTFFWVKPHNVFHTIIMYISNSKIQQATRVTWYYFKEGQLENLDWTMDWPESSPGSQLALQKRSYHQHTSILSASHPVVY